MFDRQATRLAWLLAGVALLTFVYFRVRFVGGCDPASYLMEAWRLRGLDAGLGLDATVPVRAALVPLCFVDGPAGPVSFFPPGFPVLLALAGPLGLEFHVTPLLGAAMGLALFALGRPRWGPAIALGVMAAWLLSPLVFFGATQVMSDLPAAAFGVFAWLALDRRRFVVAGVLLGISVGIRPTQLLAVPFLLALAPSWSGRGRIALGAALVGAGWLLVARWTYGAFTLPYLANRGELTGEAFGFQARFLVTATAALHAPVVALALWGLVARPRKTLPLWGWWLAFVVLYALWRTPFDAWWRARFLLPVLPALLVAAGEGAAALRQRFVASTRGLAGVGGAALVGYAVYAAWFAPSVPLHETGFDGWYERDARVVARRVGDGALVGAINESTSLRFYAGLQTFHWCSDEAPALVRWALEAGRPLFAAVGPEERPCIPDGDPRVPGMRLVEVEPLPSGRVLYRVEAQAPRRTLDVGTPAARPYLGEGWGGDEGEGAGTFAWVVGTRAVFTLPEAPEGDLEVSVALAPYQATATPVVLTVVVAGATLAERALAPGVQVVPVVVPAASRGQPVELRFSQATAPASLGGSEDQRPLAAAVEWISLGPR